MSLARSGAYEKTNKLDSASTLSGSDILLANQDTFDKQLTISQLTGHIQSGVVFEADTSTINMAFVLDEDNMASDSNTKLSTQQSIKAYVDAVVSSALTFKGSYNASTNTPDLDTSPSGVQVGDLYVVSVAGTFFTKPVSLGDTLISHTANATVEADWTIIPSIVPDASTTEKGIVELATVAETDTGTDATRAVTPASLANIQSDVDANTAKTGNATHTGAVTGSTVLTIAADAVDDTHIDFGTGAGQVSTADLPEQTNLYYTEGRVTANATVAANTAKVSADGSVTTHSDVTGPGSGIIISAGERTAIGNNTTHLSSDGTDHTFIDQDVRTTANVEFAEIKATGQAYSETNTLSDAANIATDCALGNVHQVTLAGNRTLDDPTNLKDGATYIWKITQDGAGSRTLAYGSAFLFPGGTAPVLSTGLNDVDILSGVSDGTSIFCNIAKDFS